MRHKKTIVSSALLLVLGLSGLQAQESVNATGSSAASIGGSLSYSIGQIFCQTPTGINGSIAQGVQQPYEIAAFTGIEDVKYINLSVLAYPNPTKGCIKLKVENYKMDNLNFQLFDQNGKLIKSEKIIENEATINMISLPKASYFVKITENDKEIKTQKIIKN